ncbi:hypothetical protein [Streptomyces sp. TRM68416]|uniref:hypothetical protein n=1 Tax=Streptomyces sp. TRM68416 TaxID=2758412 RepID=UPI001CB737E7|nr:hypothetical protein [Streptomyces sp. TRM68416]
MTSENVAEHEAVEPAADVSAKAVDDQLIDELVSQAQAEGLHGEALRVPHTSAFIFDPVAEFDSDARAWESSGTSGFINLHDHETTERPFAQVSDQIPLIVAGHRVSRSLPGHLTDSSQQLGALSFAACWRAIDAQHIDATRPA